MTIHVLGRLVEKRGTPAAEKLPPYMHINYDPYDYDSEPLDSFLYRTGEITFLPLNSLPGPRLGRESRNSRPL